MTVYKRSRENHFVKLDAVVKMPRCTRSFGLLGRQGGYVAGIAHGAGCRKSLF